MDKTTSYHYTIYHAAGAVPLKADWESRPWRDAEEARLENFHARSSSHHPLTLARLLYDRANLYLRFHVEDRYVVCTHAKYQDPVCQDSCVEFFVQPRSSAGYFNFEINCGGTLHTSYIEDPRRTAEGFARFKLLSAEDGRRVIIAHTMPKLVSPEKPGPLIWQVGCQIPLDVLEAYVGPLGPLPGQVWRGNFFKCADKSSHPHWASWAPIGEKLNFHQPKYFAPLRFAGADEDNSHATKKGSPHEPGRPHSNPLAE